MHDRMKNPAVIVPEAMQAIQALAQATYNGGVSPVTLSLIHLRASQINGCSWCVRSGAAQASRRDESEDRLATVAAWRDAPYFTDAERAALALSEAVRHYDEEGRAALLLSIATTNFFNRLNVPTRQVAGAWVT